MSERTTRPSRRSFAIALAAGAAATPFGLSSLSAAASPQKISLAVVGKGSFLDWTVDIGVSKGFYAKHGVDIDVISAPSSSGAMLQLAASSVDMVLDSGLVDILRAIQNGADVALIRTDAEAAPYTLVAKPEIKTITDLRHKTIIIGGKEDVTHIYLDGMLKPHGVLSNQYRLIFAGAGSARYAALAAGAADAAILPPPFNFLALSKGYTNLGVTNVEDFPFPFTGMAANKAWAKKNNAALQGFLSATTDSITWFNKDKNRAEAIDILVKQSHASPTDAANTYDFSRKLHVFSDIGAIRPKSIKALLKILVASGQISGSVDVERFIDPNFTVVAGKT